MSHSTEAERLTELIRWHIMRADGQRQGFWMRAAAVLSADALVIAGTAVLASTSSKAAWWSLATSALPLTAAMISIFEAISVIGGVRNWAYKFTEFNSPAPILYSLPETVRHFGDYEKFRETVMSRSAEKELNDAISELWRLSVLHRIRLHQLRRSMRWLQASLPLLIASVGTIIASLATSSLR
jgi:polysaccharide pyruvyl transferase WcaK-like protein